MGSTTSDVGMMCDRCGCKGLCRYLVQGRWLCSFCRDAENAARKPTDTETIYPRYGDHSIDDLYRDYPDDFN